MDTEGKTAAIDSSATPQPAFSAEAVSRALALDFGIEGELQALVSERDQNFRVSATDGRRYVFKIAGGAESRIATDLQIKVLLHLEKLRCPVPVPHLYRTLAGEESSLMFDGDLTYVCRVVSYLSGALMSATKIGPPFVESLGQSAAALDIALQDFSHPGDRQTLLWDLQRAGELRDLLPYIDDASLQSQLGRCIDDFDLLVAPVLPSLRQQVIHADLNPDNVLLESGAQNAVAGIIDFGDMTRAPLVMELAIAASYMRVDSADPLLLVRPFVSGYNRVLPLKTEELDLLFDLIRARLAGTITILHWRAATRGADDEYSSQFLQSERSAETFLARIDTMGRRSFRSALNSS
jgi:hydroxylysine kinase